MAPSTSEHDIIHNKLNVLLAKNQRFVTSWPTLRQKREEEPPTTRSEQDVEREEQEIFTPMPELLGFGASLPKDGEVKRDRLSSNDKLREQLLGKGYAKKQKRGDRSRAEQVSTPIAIGSKPRPVDTKRAAESDSEDDGGRSSLGKSRKNEKQSHIKSVVESIEDTTVESTKPEDDGSIGSRPVKSKKASNYLDEVLADRSLQKRKKSKKKKEKREATAEIPNQNS